jgi:hypothetical protein
MGYIRRSGPRQGSSIDHSDVLIFGCSITQHPHRREAEMSGLPRPEIVLHSLG